MSGGFAGLIPAAGMSTRMGAFKPLLTIGGVSMIKRAVRALKNAGAARVIVVTGFRAPEIEAELAGENAEFARNERFAQTQQLDSIKLGLSRLTDCDCVAICPADVPCVSSESIRRLVELQTRERAPAVVPVYNGKSGHPLIIDKHLLPFILGYEGDGGLRGALASGGFTPFRLVVCDEGTAQDCDTPAQYAALLRLEKKNRSLTGREFCYMRNLFAKLQKTLADGRDAVIATIIESSGSTPGKVGARMLADKNGRVYGTIGGGKMEYYSIKLAQDVIERKASRIEKFHLDNTSAADTGMICGGNASVHFAYIPADSASALELTDNVLSLIDSGEKGWLISNITGANSQTRVFSPALNKNCEYIPAAAFGDKPAIIKTESGDYFTQRLTASGSVYIFGGGHVAQSLVPALAAVGFRCVVLEDRADFCSKELFPSAAQTLLIDMNNIGAHISVTADDYICVMTRGHAYDAQAQAFAMTTPARYIGVMGSKRKIAAVTARLKAEFGFADSDFARVATPIGLDIGAQTPEEIAVSVAAQLIAVRAGR